MSSYWFEVRTPTIGELLETTLLATRNSEHQSRIRKTIDIGPAP